MENLPSFLLSLGLKQQFYELLCNKILYHLINPLQQDSFIHHLFLDVMLWELPSYKNISRRRSYFSNCRNRVDLRHEISALEKSMRRFRLCTYMSRLNIVASKKLILMLEYPHGTFIWIQEDDFVGSY